MSDNNSALAALVIAVVALIVAAVQLVQQLMATAYVIRKCDQIVTGGLTKGGVRQWHWRQFRFTVNYHAAVCALPASVYSALGVSPTVQIDTSSVSVWEKAVKLRDGRSTSKQACWVSFIQDVTKSDCLRPVDICAKEESGDRIPDDLTVAPTRVDALTALLASIAMGMQVLKYSPTTGEIALAGGVGGISSSAHPILGCLLHYSVFSDEPIIGFEASKRHGRALRQERGIWANAVFGRFMARSFRPEFIAFNVMLDFYIPILRSHGWPENDDTHDTIGGAACFMTFAHVDVSCRRSPFFHQFYETARETTIDDLTQSVHDFFVYEAVPPSIARPWCAHFAEIIVKSHHLEIVNNGLKDAATFILSPAHHHARQVFIDRNGCSSPYLHWEDIEHDEGTYTSCKKEHDTLEALLFQFEYKEIFATPALITGLNYEWPKSSPPPLEIPFENQDPSDYVPVAVSWEIIMRADQCMRHVRLMCDLSPRKFKSLELGIVATAICPLSNSGAPSWAPSGETTDDARTFWTEKFPAACDRILTNQSDKQSEEKRHLGCDHWIRVYARLSILRAAYYTIMMRATPEIGPGLTGDSRIDTALAYMA